MSRAFLAISLTFALASGAACGSPTPSEPTSTNLPAPAEIAAAQGRARVALQFDDGVTVAHPAWPSLHFSTQAAFQPSPWRREKDVFLGAGLGEEARCHLRELVVGKAGAVTPATEVWCPREENVEHAFKFAARPSTPNLKIAIDVSNGRPSASDTRGVYWRTPNGLALAYGQAAWIDASGRRFPVGIAYAENAGDGAIELTVTQDVLDATQYPAVLDPTLGSWTRVADPSLRPSDRYMRPVLATALGDDAAVFLRSFDDTETAWVRMSPSGAVTLRRPAPFDQYTGNSPRHSGPNGVFFATYAAETDDTIAAHHFLLASGAWAYRNVPAGPSVAAISVEPTATGYRVYRRTSFNDDPTWLAKEAIVLSNGTTASEGGFGQAITSLPGDPYARAIFTTGTNQHAVITGFGVPFEAHILDGSTLTQTISLTAGLPAGPFYSLDDADVAPDGTLVAAFGSSAGGWLVSLVGGTATSFDLEMGPLDHVVYGHGRFLVTTEDGQWRVFTPGVGLGPIHSGGCAFPGPTTAVATYSGGFVIAIACNWVPYALQLDPMGNQIGPSEGIPILYDEQDQEPLALIPRDADSAWAIWRDNRDPVVPAVFARAIDWTGLPVSGTAAMGDAVTGVIGADVGVFSTKTSTAGIVAWAMGGEFRGAMTEGAALQPVSIALDPTRHSLARPLIVGGAPGAIVREQLDNCAMPPCAGLTLLGELTPPLPVLGDWLEIFHLEAASGDAVSWFAAIVQSTEGVELRALPVESLTEAPSLESTLIAELTSVAAIDGIAVGDEGELALVWQTGDTPNNASAHFSLVTTDGVVTTVDLAAVPSPAGMVALGEGRGFLYGDTLFRAAGQDIEVLTGLTNAVGDIAGVTDGQGNVVVGRPVASPAGSTRFEVASLFVGEALGAPCATADECGTGFCEEGVCCEVACGLCERCDLGDVGRCEPAPAGNDNSCFGSSTCTAEGDCKPANGQSCATETDCASGFCVGGVCCDGACEDACGACEPGVGICTLKECGAYGCEGGGLCKSECESTLDCGVGFVCTADGRCVAPAGEVAPAGDGCGCRVAGSKSQTPGPGGAWLLLGALGLVSRRRSARR